MKTSTLGLLMAGLALAVAGGASQALAMQKCGPVGGCDGGDRCNKNGLWIADKSCAIKIPGPPILPANQKAQSARGESAKSPIFDRWGKMKTKKDCETEGGVWDGGAGQGGCTGPRTGTQK